MDSDIVKHQIARMLINLDVVALATEPDGQPIKERKSIVSDLQVIRKMIRVNGVKKAHLESIGDVHFGCSLNKYLVVLMRLGFKLRHVFPITRRASGEEDTAMTDKLCVFTHQDGLLLQVETYGIGQKDRDMVSVNTATLSYNWVPNVHTAEYKYPVHGSGGWESPSRPTWRRTAKVGDIPDDMFLSQYMDVREGLVTVLKTLRDAGSFLNPWPKVPHMGSSMRMLVVSDDYRTPAYDELERSEQSGYISKLRDERIAQLPQDVRDMINL